MKRTLQAALACLVVMVQAPVWTASAAPAPAALQSAAALQVGSLTITGGSSAQRSFSLSCPEMKAAIGGTLWVSPATSTPRGLVVGFSGGYGTVKWTEGFSIDSTFLNNLLAAGYEVVQVQWSQPGWEQATSGERAGAANAACRPATAIYWVYSNLYLPLHVASPARGACGFCITGTSGGASQVAYALAYYGLAPIVNASIPVSGPPHAAIAKGCLNSPGYAYDQLANGAMALALMDSSWGYFNGTGPCVNHQSSFASSWNAESSDTGGSSYSYPNTRVHVILGGYDSQVIIHHADDYIARLTSSGSPMVSSEVVPKMPHDVMSSANGLAALLAAIEGHGSGVGPPPAGASPAAQTPSPSASPSTSASPGGPGSGTSGGNASPSASPSVLASLTRAGNRLALGVIVGAVLLVVLLAVLILVTRGRLVRSAVQLARSGFGRNRPPRKPG